MGNTVLFFCRGQGYNHATRDLVLADAITKLNNEVLIEFASYGDGYRAIIGEGHACHNMERPPKEQGDEHDRFVRMGKTIRDVTPHLIISDEELLPLPLAEMYGIPCCLISNWLPPRSDHLSRTYFSDPEKVLLTVLKGTHAIPAWLKVPVHFVGPILDPTQPSPDDRRKARKEIGIDAEEKLIMGIAEQGKDSDARFLEFCLEAFKRLDLDARLMLVAGKFSRSIKQKVGGKGNIDVKAYIRHAKEYMLASDLVLTRGGYFTLWRLANLGTPSICVPRTDEDFGEQNLAHTRSMEELKTTVVLKEGDATSEDLLGEMNRILSSEGMWNEIHLSALKVCQQNQGTGVIAEIILSTLASGL